MDKEVAGKEKAKMSIAATMVKACGQTIHIEGTAVVPEGRTKPGQLLIKKRGTEIQFFAPVNWDGSDWRANVESDQHAFQRGTWDFYLQGDEDKAYRVKIDDEVDLEAIAPVLHRDGKEPSNLLTPYRTVKGSLSMKVAMASLEMDQFKAELDAKDGVIYLFSELKKDPYYNGDAPRLVLKQRGDGAQRTYLLDYDPVADAGKVSISYEKLISADSLHNMTWDVYVEMEVDGVPHLFRLHSPEDLPDLEAETSYEVEADFVYRFSFYLTVKGNLSVHLRKLQVERELQVCEFAGDAFRLSGYAYLDAISFDGSNTFSRQLVVQNRDTRERTFYPLPGMALTADIEDAAQYKMAGFDISVPLSDIVTLGGEFGRFDFYVRMEYSGKPYERKLGFHEYTYFKDDYMKKTEVKLKGGQVKAYVSVTPGGNILLETYQLSMAKSLYLKFGQGKDQKKGSEKEIWLIGERPDTAQDTGYHFFKWMREHHPEIDAYYVIDPASKDYEKVAALGNVVEFGSMKHLRVASAARTFIGSHDLEYILPLKAEAFNNFVHGRRVFLQHGVFGRKNVEYHKFYYKYPFQLFCVSSEPEKRIVETKLEYAPEAVQVTGLSRFDRLAEAEGAADGRTILLMPTWRDWLTAENAFRGSAYFERYHSLLENEQLHAILEQHDLTLKFYPHYRMQPFVESFDGAGGGRVHIIKQGEQTVQDLLLESSLLITDYSSVSFDFNYMGKPVIFYHFDAEAFFKNGIVRPVEETFLGDVCKNEDQVVGAVAEYADNGFAEKTEFAAKKDLVFTHVDAGNCQRIFDAIQALPVQQES